MAVGVTREQLLGFRLQRHNLAQRLAAGSLVKAAAVCGIQNTPPGSALLSLYARVQEVTGAALDRALLSQQSLVQVWSVRAAPLIVPTSDAAVFTEGVLPQDEAELRFFIQGAGEHLDRIGMTAAELVAHTAQALPTVLAGSELTKDELGVALARQMEQHVPPDLRDLWNSPDEWGHFGESLARFALNAVSLQGTFCVISHPGRAATFVLTDDWLGRPFAQRGPQESAAELLRRYLSAYGPSTASHFAQWAGIAPAKARRAWRAIEAELASVEHGGKTAWLRQVDVPDLQAAVLPEGVRLLPPHDPYLAARDRAMLLPDKQSRAQVWRAVGSPGAVLNNGEIVAAWRAQKRGTTLHAGVGPFGRLPPPLQWAVEVEFSAIAPLRGCHSAKVTFT
jgi:hypothetical protein